jgi:hypothetical protein
MNLRKKICYIFKNFRFIQFFYVHVQVTTGCLLSMSASLNVLYSGLCRVIVGYVVSKGSQVVSRMASVMLLVMLYNADL